MLAKLFSFRGRLTRLQFLGWSFAATLIFTVSAVLFIVLGVVDGRMNPAVTGLIAILAVAQIFVHLYYFLHMNASSEQRWNVMAFVFTVVVVAIVVGGTLWVMHNANILMMPGMHTMSGMN